MTTNLTGDEFNFYGSLQGTHQLQLSLWGWRPGQLYGARGYYRPIKRIYWFKLRMLISFFGKQLLKSNFKPIIVYTSFIKTYNYIKEIILYITHHNERTHNAVSTPNCIF